MKNIKLIFKKSILMIVLFNIILLAPFSSVCADSTFIWPLKQGSYTVSSNFGDYRNNDDPAHKGMDLAASAGTPIYASASGTVIRADSNANNSSGYGIHARIQTGDILVIYGHMSAINVTDGQTVNQGDLIGYVGSTGNSSGNHLHFEFVTKSIDSSWKPNNDYVDRMNINGKNKTIGDFRYSVNPKLFVDQNNFPSGSGDNSGGTNQGSGNGQNGDNSAANYNSPEALGEDPGISQDNFEYYGLPEVEGITTNKKSKFMQAIENILAFKLSDIMDYIIGLNILAIKLPVLGLAELVEIVISTGMDAAMGVDVSSRFDNIFVFIASIPKFSRNVTIENIVYNNIPLLNVNIFDIDGIKEKYNNYQGTGALTGQASQEAGNQEFTILEQIAKSVGQWYYVFRYIVIIVMLLILIYTGIRMALSTIAEGKAKYKRMLVAWLVSFIIVFGIHYYMVLIMQLNEGIIDIVIPKTTEGTEITLYETVRTRAFELKASRAIVGTIMYLLLIWYTLKFLWIYVKRFLAVMFLILMAPFVGASFAVNKIKDGKTPIFNNWMKEYTFNVIIQAIHAALYGLFVQLALNLSTTSLAGIVLAFVLISFMSKADKLVRRVFKIRPGTKNSILDNNLSVDDEIASLVKNPLGTLVGGKVASAYMKHWVKPMTKKTLNLAKNVASIPLSATHAAAVTGAREYLTSHPGMDHDSINYALLNALAGTTMAHEYMPVLDAFGNKIYDTDGNPLRMKKANWHDRGMFVLDRYGVLKYYNLPSTDRKVFSDIDAVINLQHAKSRKANIERVKNMITTGANALKGAALITFSIPLLIDSPALGMVLLTQGLKDVGPAYANKRNLKIKGYRGRVYRNVLKRKGYSRTAFEKDIKFFFKGLSRASLGSLNAYIRPIENAIFDFEEMGIEQEKDAKILLSLYKIRDAEADMLEHLEAGDANILNLRDWQHNFLIAEDDLKKYAEKVENKDFYKDLNKEIDKLSNDIRAKIHIHKFIKYTFINGMHREDEEERLRGRLERERFITGTIAGGERHYQLFSIDRDAIGPQNLAESLFMQDVDKFETVMQSEVNLESDTHFKAKFDAKINELFYAGNSTITDSQIVDITRQIEAENNVRTALGRNLDSNESIGPDKITQLRDGLERIYGDRLGADFEDRIKDLFREPDPDDPLSLAPTEITVEEAGRVLLETLNENIVLDDVKISANDIDGMRSRIESALAATHLVFDADMEAHIKEKIEADSNTNVNALGQKVITAQELKDMIYEEVLNKGSLNSDEILTKEEVQDVVDMIRDAHSGKDEEFTNQFARNIEKQMEEKIIQREIDRKVQEKEGKTQIDDRLLAELETRINDELNNKGYNESMQDVIDHRDMSSELEESLRDTVAKQDNEKAGSHITSEVAELAQMIKDATKKQDSVHFEFESSHPHDFETAMMVETLQRDMEVLRALNNEALKLGAKRELRGRQKLSKDVIKKGADIVNIKDLLEDIMDSINYPQPTNP